MQHDLLLVPFIRSLLIYEKKRLKQEHFTFGSLAFSNQERALRVSWSQEEPHSIVSRDVPEEPPATQTYFELTTSSPSETRHASHELRSSQMRCC